MKLDDIHRAHFLGIGGIGMSSLALYFISKGVQVSGYDRTESSITKELVQKGADVFYDDQINFILDKENIDVVVYTPAIPKSNNQLSYFLAHHDFVIKRAELLGLMTKNNFCIAVAGTHGKTTTSSIVAHMLEYSGLGCTAFLGGMSSNYNSNLILNQSSNNVVVEADEYDRSFLSLSPDIVLLTSIDADHLDVYGSIENIKKGFQKFIDLISESGILVSNYGLDVSANNTLFYGESNMANFRIQNIRVENHEHYFDLSYNDVMVENIHLGVPGYHNVYNAAAAVVLGIHLGIEMKIIKSALATFKGVKRRFEYLLKTSSLVYIDDYAHHPNEIEACLYSVKQLFPGKKITVIFQPHLFSRTSDFMDDFASSLSKVDELILLEIYPARELPIEGISSNALLNRIDCTNKILVSKEELIPELENRILEVVLTMGAGDIDRLVDPIKDMLDSKIAKN